MTSEQRTCPVCAAAFTATDRAAFALHVADCTTPALASASLSSSSSPFTATVIDGVATATCAASIQHCALCHHVYASGTAEHVVQFHAFECARVNKRKAKAKAAAAASAQRPLAKRPREPSSGASDDTASLEAAASPATTTSPLFPAHCALCSNGGRSLLQCDGGCMRSFHTACIDSVMPGNSKVPSATVTGLSAAPAAWRCAECARDVHACMHCGFLGHTSNTLTPCSVRDCGYFVHTTCRRPAATTPFVCPRHTCATCGAVETDMRACTSCTKCFKATHRQCPSATGATPGTSLRGAAASDVTTPLVLCDAHSASSSKAAVNSPDATLALKYRVQQGDIVLVLECANALLPQSAKAAAPDASNQWGIVSRAENIDGRDQLLAITLFSDGSAVSVPNQYVLPLGTANAFASPHVMLRDCIKWHAVAELNIRRSELDAAAATDAAAGNDVALTDVRDQVLNASCSAFYARAETLGLSISQLFGAATEGYTFWSTHRTELANYAGSGAPIYVYLDTRAPSKSASRSAASASRSETNGAAPSGGNAGDGDDDVDMDGGDDDAPAGSGHSAASGSDSGSGAQALEGASGVQGSGLVDTPVRDAATAAVVATMLNDMISSVERHAAESAPVAMKNSNDDVLMTESTPVLTEKKLAVSDTVASVKPVSLKADPTVAVAVAPPSSLNDAALVDGVEVKVKADVTFAVQDTDSGTADDGERAAKCPKLSLDSMPPRKGADPLAVVQPPSPLLVLTATTKPTSVAPSTNAFVRAKAPVSASALPVKHASPSPRRTRKERMLAEYSPQLLRELERQAAVFLEQEANPPSRRTRKSPSPQHCDAFPAATASEAFRTPYFRPSVVFSRARGRRMDGLSRILLSQDKRNIKCFIQGTDANRCLHQPPSSMAPQTQTQQQQPEGTFVTIDLMSVDSFRALDMVIRTRMIAAVEQDDRYLHEMFGTYADRARRVLQDRKSAVGAIEIYYCCYDGSRTKVARNSDDWLCFCANVCHLTAVIPLQAVE